MIEPSATPIIVRTTSASLASCVHPFISRKIAATVKALGTDRFDLKYSAGTTPHDRLMKSIELYGARVIPMAREMLADKDKAA